MSRPKKEVVHPLRPPYPASMRGNNAPGDLTAMKLEPGMAEVLERQALDIFTLMANAGHPFAKCLSSILLTGLDWGVNAQKKDPNASREPDRIIV